MNSNEENLIDEFRKIVGEIVPYKELKLYLNNSGNNLELALNMYFRANEKKEKIRKSIEIDQKKINDLSTKDFHLNEKILFYERLGKPIPEELKKIKENLEKEKSNEKKEKHTSDPLNAFSLLKKGAQQTLKVDNAIKELKTNYTKSLNLARNIPNVENQNELNYSDTHILNLRKKNNENILDKFDNMKESFKNTMRTPEKNIRYNEKSHSFSQTKRKYDDIIDYDETSDLFPITFGKMVVEAHINRSSIKSILSEGDEIYLKRVSKVIEIPQKGKKKKVKSKQNDHLITVIYTKNNLNEEIAKLEPEYSEILAPLLDYDLITIEGKINQCPKKIAVFEKLEIEVLIYLLRRSITKPNYHFSKSQELEELKNTKSNFISLFLFSDIKRISMSALGEMPYDSLKTNNPFFRKKILEKLNRKDRIVQKPNLTSSNEDINSESSEDLCFTHHLLPKTKPSPSFKSNLHPYQEIALTWMLKREGFDISEQDKPNLHPLWEIYELPNGKWLYFNPFSGQLSVKFPEAGHECYGGILADEMGLGKTVMLISLIHSNKPWKSFSSTYFKIQAKTLIVVPVGLLSQWTNEIYNHSVAGSIQQVLFYGKDRSDLSLDSYDIVLTSYNTMQIDYHSGEKLLYKYKWFRVILDEAHMIKGRSTMTARAAYALEAKSRWCLSGTPIQNNNNEIFSLIHFLKYQPWCNYEWWSLHMESIDTEGLAIDTRAKLKKILKEIMMRRVKYLVLSESLKIPDKKEETIFVNLNKDEENIYSSLFESSKQEFRELEEKGLAVANYWHIFEKLLRLRQLCNHKYLIKTKGTQIYLSNVDKDISRFLISRGVLDATEKLESELYKVSIESIKNGDLENCTICMSSVYENDPVMTKCLHIFCQVCIYQCIEKTNKCPICRVGLTFEDITNCPRASKFNVDLESNYVPSSKIECITEEISRIQNDDKIVIFSQFLGMMDLITHDLKLKNIQYLRYDGSMNKADKDLILEKFEKSEESRILIISFKAGSLGLNLIAANHVFLVDPWWNPSAEDQAIDRIHRIGQKKEVYVKRFICKSTIEEKMIEIHKKKRFWSSVINIEEKESAFEKIKIIFS